jgi:SAM-dependent methyltransferase
MRASFDTVAAGYDAAFSHTRLGRELRRRVWERLEAAFAPGQQVLELACGTGEDALHLARRGVRVLATDASAAMLEIAAGKTAGLPVEHALFDLHSLSPAGVLAARAPFAGAYANFGGLNVLAAYEPLAECLANVVEPGGCLIFVIMGRWCAWEIAWHLAHAQPRLALRRLRQGGAAARIGQAVVRVHYPSTRQLCRAFGAQFRLRRVRPLGALLPPTYLEPLTRRRFFPFGPLASIDRRLTFPLLADHTIYEWIRRS